MSVTCSFLNMIMGVKGSSLTNTLELIDKKKYKQGKCIIAAADYLDYSK